VNVARRLERVAAAAILVASLAAAVAAGGAAVTRGSSLARVAWGSRAESYAAAQERLLGAAYIESIRAVRAAVPEHGTIHFIDAEDSPSGATYLALHYLAPRRLALVGVRRQSSPRRLRRELPAGIERVLIVGEHRQPLRWVAVEQLGSALADDR